MSCVILNCKKTRVDNETSLCAAHYQILNENPSVFPSTHKIKSLSSSSITAIFTSSSTRYTHLMSLSKGTAGYKKIEARFLRDWVKNNTQGLRVEAIYNIIFPSEITTQYKNYKNQVESQINYQVLGLPEANEKLLWHGTDQLCCILYDKPTTVPSPCATPNCPGCGILMNSFSMNKVGVNHQGRTFQRLGQGLYFTPHSSKAHFYGHQGAKSLPNDSGRYCRIMFLSKVVLGKPWEPEVVSQNARGPPEGYNSTWGRVGYCPHGGAKLNYEEYAVYRQEACLPVNYIAYSYTSSSE
ncbi:6243_t:CDS:2 [Ambispora gerdemannii]|uniref:Poly [ADP-ribose] polymerase n=1 Tax=Ambispora gerdemannii TaxID=144530 RepID=A0A9N9ANV4_9GLOM|nr:6243_t:CDS:2 [Ambispora gerdemannii]